MTIRVKLTEERVRALKPPETGESIVWDTEIPGFGVRCFASGRRVFIFQYRLGGRGAKQRRITFNRAHDGKAGPLTTPEARRRARSYLASVDNGADPQAERKEASRKDAAHIDAALDAYETYLNNRKVVNTRQIMSQLRRELSGLPGASDLSSINRQTVAARVTRLEEKGQPGAAQGLRSHATTFFNWAVNRGLIYANPLAGWRRERATRAQITARKGKALSPDEIRAVWLACGSASPPFGDYLRILILLGQRRTETARMRWQDIDLPADVWTIPANEAKNGREHDVALPEFVKAIINQQARFAGSAFVFAGRGGSAMAGWSKRHKVIVEESGVEFKLHDCRRTFRSGLRFLGVDSELAEMMLNHARADLIERYDREPRWQERMQAAQKWADHVAALVAPKTSDTVVPLAEWKTA